MSVQYISDSSSISLAQSLSIGVQFAASMATDLKNLANDIENNYDAISADLSAIQNFTENLPTSLQNDPEAAAWIDKMNTAVKNTCANYVVSNGNGGTAPIDDPNARLDKPINEDISNNYNSIMPNANISQCIHDAANNCPAADDPPATLFYSVTDKATGQVYTVSVTVEYDSYNGGVLIDNIKLVSQASTAKAMVDAGLAHVQQVEGSNGMKDLNSFINNL